MPRYRVRAVDRSGSLIVTVSEAAGSEQLRVSLIERGWTIVSIKSIPGQRLHQWRLQRAANSVGVLLVRQLGELLHVGVPVVVALQEVRQLAPAGPLSNAWGRVSRAVEQGESLVDAIESMPGLFLDRHLAVLSVGLSQPKLATALLDVAAELSWRGQLVQRLRLAASYPIFAAIVLFLVSVFFFLQVVPALMPILVPVKSELPWVTQKIVAFSVTREVDHGTLSGNTFFLFFVAVLVLFLVVILGSKHIPLSLVKTRILSTRVYQQWVWPFSIAMHARSVQLMLKQGMPLPEAVRLAAFAAGTMGTRRVWLEVAGCVERDGLLGHAVKRAQVLPNLYESLIKVGERHNTLEASLEMSAKLYHERITLKLDHLSTLIGPVLLLMVGAVMACGFAWVVVPVYDAIAAQGSL